MTEFLLRLERTIWSWPLLLLILGTGVYLTVRLCALQFRRLPMALRSVFEKSDGEKGEISPFAALCTSLSACIGTGNIVGVATAILIGGPGALLWMELSALTGMAVKYAEGFLAVKYRAASPDGSFSGGPFRYIENGLGKKFRPMAKLFALFGAIAGVCGVGTFVQVNSITSMLRSFLAQNVTAKLPQISVFGQKTDLVVVVCGVLLTVFATLIILGGIRRISAASSVLVPAMAGVYVVSCLWILCANAGRLPDVFTQVLQGAFSGRAALGGAAGGVLACVQAGISRGVFSNEAGLGTAPIATAATKSDNPVKQGLVSMTAVFFDTTVMCTITGLVLLVTGAAQSGAQSSAMGMLAFELGLPLPSVICHGIVLLCLTLFAFTTVIGWNYYGVQCLRYLLGSGKTVTICYQALYIASVLIAPYFSVQTVWTAANICNGLMAIPNLIAVLLLSGVVVQQTREFFVDVRKRNGV